MISLRKKLAIFSLNVVTATALVFGVAANADRGFTGFTAETQQYTLTLNNANGGNGFASSYSNSESLNNTARTTSGAEVDIKYQNTRKATGYYAEVGASGYFYNVDNKVVKGIKGIDSIKVTFSGTLSLYTSDTQSFPESGTVLTSNTAISLDGTDIYFKLLNNGGNATQITSVEIKYSCVAKPKVSYYEKVMSTSEVTDGKYLIVYESGSLALNGALTSIDVENDYIDVSIVDNKVQSTTTIDASAFTINASEGTIQSEQNYYIGHTGSGKTLNSSESLQSWCYHTITVNNGVASLLVNNQTYELRYNTSANRFRYYQGTQQPVSLYKLGGSGSGNTTPDPDPTPSVQTYSVDITTANSGLTNSSTSYDQQNKTWTLSDGVTNIGGSWSGNLYNNTKYNEIIMQAGSSLTSTTTVVVKTISIDWYGSYENHTVKANGTPITGTTSTIITNAIGTAKDYAINSANWSISNETASYTASLYKIVITCEIQTGPVAVTGVSLNKSNLELYREQSEQLLATVLPENATNTAVVWSSSSDSVATVDQSGNVTGVSAGNATISVTTEDGGFSAQCTVTVSQRVAVTGITLDKTELTIFNGKSKTLYETVQPENATNKNVTWSSSNEEIVTVSSYGTIHANSVGIATITVTTEDGGKTATCAVTVEPISVTGITIDPTTLDLGIGQETTLEATVSPSDADNKNFSWSVDDSTVISLDNGHIVALKEGTATVTVTTQDGHYSATCTVNVAKSPAPVVGSQFELVTNINNIASGDYVIFVCDDADKAAGRYNSSYNYLESVPANITNSTVTFTNQMKAYQLGQHEEGWTLKFGDQYLSKNGTKLSLAELSSDGYWSIAISNSMDSEATVSVDGDTSIRYNNSSPRFNLYSGTTNSSDIQIYKLSGKVSSVTLNGSDIGVNVNHTYNLEASIHPDSAFNNRVSWSSSNTSIATVVNGVVTGKAVGHATITATTEDGQKTASCLIRVQSGSTIVAEEISIDKVKEKLPVGQTLQINETIKPSNVTNPTVTWTSSSTSIATVSNTGLVTAVSNNVVTITASINGHSAQCQVRVTLAPYAEWTLMFYVCGSNLEGGDGETPDGCATRDINEMLQAADQPDNVNIVLECGGSELWENNAIQAYQGQLSRWHIRNQQLVFDEAQPGANMGLTSTFRSFLEYGMNNYPAKKYGVFMWNHGGAMDGCCFDDLYNGDCLTNSEVYNATLNARSTCEISNKLEFIAYDACLMGVQDIAEYNSLNYNYMLSSQETEWDGGYVYNEWLPALYEEPTTISTEDLLSYIGETFMDYWDGRGYCDQTQAVYDLTKMKDYKNAVEALASSLNGHVTWSTLSPAIRSGLRYGRNDQGESDYDVYDVNSVMQIIKTSYSSYANLADAVLTELNKVIVYNRCGTDEVVAGSSGMSVFLPIGGYYRLSSKSFISSQSHFTNWINFGYSYYG